jgi:hypothetical protein
LGGGKFLDEPNFPIEAAGFVFTFITIAHPRLVDWFYSACSLHSLSLDLVFKMAASMRSIAPFLRTARYAFKQNTNPLVSLQRQSRTPLVNLARTYATYERTKPHVNIGMGP